MGCLFSGCQWFPSVDLRTMFARTYVFAVATSAFRLSQTHWTVFRRSQTHGSLIKHAETLD